MLSIKSTETKIAPNKQHN